MSNQLNYATEIQYGFQRPTRLDSSVEDFVSTGKNQVLFGTSDKDHIELWIYSPDGLFAGHQRIFVTDSKMLLMRVADGNGSVETLNIDLDKSVSEMNIPPGQYNMVANFFSDEIGSESTYKMYIAEISPSRTELKLKLVTNEKSSIKDIFEFVVPSVPRKYVQPLIDQMFGMSLDAGENEKITLQSIVERLPANSWSRIQTANLVNEFTSIVMTINQRTHDEVLNRLAADVTNYRVQHIELENYIKDSLNYVIGNMISAKEIDTRFKVI